MIVCRNKNDMNLLLLTAGCLPLVVLSCANLNLYLDQVGLILVVPSCANLNLYLDQVGLILVVPSCANLNIYLDQVVLAMVVPSCANLNLYFLTTFWHCKFLYKFFDLCVICCYKKAVKNQFREKVYFTDPYYFCQF